MPCTGEKKRVVWHPESPIDILSNMKAQQGAPFAWALKPAWIARPEGPVKALLDHSQAQGLSDALHQAYLLAYKSPERSKSKQAFDQRLKNNYDEAIAALYELLVLALCRMESWELVDVEPKGKGNRRPDFLMRVPHNGSILIEVKTITEDVFKIKKHLIEQLKRGHFVCSSLEIVCTANQASLNKAVKADIAKGLLSLAKANKRRGLSFFSMSLPHGGTVQGHLAGVRPHGPLAGQISKINRISEKALGSHSAFKLKLDRNFDEGDALGKRLADSMEEKSAQIDSFGQGVPGIIALCMADSDISIQEAIAFSRQEILRRKEIDAHDNISAVLFASFYLPQIDRLRKEITGKGFDAQLSALRQQDGKIPPVVGAAWMDMNSALPKPRIIETLEDDLVQNSSKYPKESIFRLMYLLEDQIQS